MFGIKSQPKIIKDEIKIDELLNRSIANVLPTKDGLKKELMSGKRLRIYIGADATGPDLHLGHSTNFFLMERLRRLGHEVIILFGDFTAMIGDPSDKEAVRKRLTKEDVNKNIKTWKEQISYVLDVKNRENPVRFEKNSKWLETVNFEKLADLASNFTVQQMIERDMFDNRLKNNKPIYLHEFLYPLMVGYDSVVLDVDVEVGGNDQTFNMLAGRTLQEKISKKNKFVIATTLLENPLTGKKLMSKSEGGYVSLQDKPNDMFGKIMALPDGTIIPLFIDATWRSMESISDLKLQLETGENPKNIKLQLAKEIVTIYHSEAKAKSAQENFENTFGKGGTPDDIIEIKVNEGDLISKVLIKIEIVSSNGEWKRLIGSGAVSYGDGEKIKDKDAKIKETRIIKVGKRRFVKLVIN